MIVRIIPIHIASSRMPTGTETPMAKIEELTLPPETKSLVTVEETSLEVAEEPEDKMAVVVIPTVV